MMVQTSQSFWLMTEILTTRLDEAYMIPRALDSIDEVIHYPCKQSMISVHVSRHSGMFGPRTEVW